ncbi:Myc-type, basic helix-loop-helix (bHLH) domain-containing protein [Artemisia annua]|uniref:Myc-type, basic helix-loop-helix (BHLH) domain-containing protein n=1 Tax=Artemisia annua TaxID=35608 RepID=A0A2U1P9K1_ARTAN|nr:Myc-type, basic helix-loop-helix (bHLH) domain-containing protein [Artemisia annua]
MGTIIDLGNVSNVGRNSQLYSFFNLQNQIEFLSMKLSAASMYYDFNSPEMDALDTIKGANGYEAQVMDRMGAEGYGDLLQFQPTWPL